MLEVLVLVLTPHAQASCSVALREPADGTVAQESATFRWVGTCRTWRLQVSPEGTFRGSDVTTFNAGAARSYTLPEDEWNSWVGASWSAGVYWRVTGRASDGTAGLSSAMFLGIDPDLDDDGVSVGEGDCDDADATSYPGAVETCDDGADNDCLGDGDCSAGIVVGAADADAIVRGASSPAAVGTDIEVVGDVDGDGVVDFGIGDEDVGASGAVYILAGPLVGEVFPSSAFATIEGSPAWDGAPDGTGNAVTAVDVDGDGWLDLVAGAPYADTTGWADEDSGGVYLFLGPVAGTSDVGAADAQLLGDYGTSSRAGTYVGPAGDQNGDGLPEYLVGDLGRSSVHVVAGRTRGATDLLWAAEEIVAEGDDDGVGSDIYGGHDLDGDGTADFLIGGDSEDTNGTDAGAVYVVLGPVTSGVSLSSAEAKVLGAAAGDEFGRHPCVSDVDGDGAEDIITTRPGGVYMFTTRPSGVVVADDAAAHVLEGGDTTVGWGFLGVAPGDFDGDGQADLVVTSSNDDTAGEGAGAAWLHYGPFASAGVIDEGDVLLTGEDTLDRFGTHPTSVGDVDGDARDDILVSAIEADAVGAVYLFHGI